MYQALYRKWRPRNFGAVLGQDAITSALLNQIRAGRVAHAYLFTGTRGTGKTTCAKVLAKAVNCKDLQADGPCGVCVCCQAIENGSVLDVVEIDAASNNGVDDVRDLREETMFRPSLCAYRVYIIDEVHMLSIQAFNALLKILEEPPSHVLFILATTEIHKVPATILSRCQRFDFMRISKDVIAEHLLDIAAKEKINLSEEAASLVAVLGDGSMRDALSLLDTCAAFGEEINEELVRTMAGVTDKAHLFSLASAAMQADISALLTQVSALREHSVDIKRLCEELVAHYRNCLLALSKSDGSLLDFLPNDEKEQYLKTTKELTQTDCIRALRRLSEALDRMGRSPNPRVELELALFDIALGEKKEALPSAKVLTPTFEKPPVAIQNTVNPDSVVSTPQASTITQKAPVSKPPVPSSNVSDNTDISVESVLLKEEAFSEWPQVVAQIAQMDAMVHSFIKGTTAYFDGKRVLLDGSDVFLEFMRSNKNVSEVIKSAIQSVTGTRYGIGPYQSAPKENALAETTKRTLTEWQEKGVAIEYETITNDKGDSR